MEEVKQTPNTKQQSVNDQPTHIDLFAGIGGFSLAFEAEGFRTVAYSEINPDKCLVYEHHFPGVRNLGDIKAINASSVDHVDVLTGGVPCQPASALGQMRGTADERWLWPEVIRLVGAIRPRFGVFENPPSLLVLEGGRAWNGIVSGLVACGYDCWWDVFPAAAIGAGHLRERLLLTIADSHRGGWGARRTRGHSGDSEGTPEQTLQLAPDARGSGRDTRAGLGEGEPEGQWRGRSGDAPGEDVTHAHGPGLQGHAGHEPHGDGRTGTGRPVAPPDLRGRVHSENWWHEVNTGVPVLAHGLPARLVEAAARCAGDSVVPQVIQPIARAIFQQIANAAGDTPDRGGTLAEYLNQKRVALT